MGRGWALLMACGLAVPAGAGAQTVLISGRVLGEAGQPVGYAQVSVVGTSLTAVTGVDGTYRLAAVPAGRQVVRVEAVGYGAAERVVEVGASPLVVDVQLQVSALPLDAIVVTGTMTETTVAESAVKVDVVSGRLLPRLATENLMESIQHVNGLFQQVDCGVCYTNNIRINGMEGPYTAVLIDGMPIMGGLASVYGLNGINPSLVEQLEIVKGPSSTLYGTEAMGGVVNVITKDPRFAPRLVAELSRALGGETTLELAVSPRVAGVDALVSGSYGRLSAFEDGNGDRFTDVPQYERATLFARADLRRGDTRRARFTLKAYREDRFGGVRGWTEADRGSSTVYGESIETNRLELMGDWRLPWLGESLEADAALTWHEQDSWYGEVRYAATQRIAYGQLVWHGGSPSHDLLAGTTVRWQSYDDDTPATRTADRRWIPGVFVQDEWVAGSGLTLLGGLRFDHHAAHGWIGSPRVSLKFEPWHDTQLRLNAGTGFRVVNLFTENHAALTGARQVVIREALEPERSWSVTGNLNQVLDFGVNPMMIDVDAFYTRFTNRIVPDYDTDPDLIIYDNLSGYAVTRGLALSLNQNFARFPLLYTAGITVQDVYVVRGGERGEEFFAPDWKAVWSVSYSLGSPPLVFDYTGTAVGPMRLPEYAPPFTRPTRSPVYAVHNLKTTWRTGTGLEAWVAVNNAFDFRQGSPLIDPANPFGDAFDTTYVWGPIRGRQLRLGLRFGVSR